MHLGVWVSELIKDIFRLIYAHLKKTPAILPFAFFFFHFILIDADDGAMLSESIVNSIHLKMAVITMSINLWNFSMAINNI